MGALSAGVPETRVSADLLSVRYFQADDDVRVLISSLESSDDFDSDL